MTTIRDVTSDELQLFGAIVGRLERLTPEVDLRAAVLGDVIRLLRADFGASYIWRSEQVRFQHRVGHNMDPDNLKTYDEWFQFHDPMTAQLRQCRRATFVEQVLPRREMVRTAFYNDFLARDGLHHGINMYVFDGDEDLGDFRIWRSARRPDFEQRDLDLLNALEPFLRRALQRGSHRYEQLTARESDVAALVARGCTDRDIARLLNIGFATVRTHINRAMQKRCCANRAELAALIARESLNA
ncbi:response regulator transcription factor [Bradyrhizobium sp. U87765 SZCCT0131]|uniref:helix-turn-helix transcriptional regulator n=1 Tax=unclassified Bradyrhizobium TaxID=2631580 RepID=UPI001BA8B22A|nr:MULTISPECIES: LuxR C-terminal-related transcriptional regulator [unclassified Bradyrhizobium]MBR1217216.1 response regulator transcription factor [Bradyrhizobium sp. U87765 SZCCT0131]MBR1259028.1 response regulator transcription factor [Bradyrhizobium sp. U87765 SZCCT0134]MBR1305169.1 response regulator transcription factor [Bradyrhizobium sp. U87765 SZCCT0110]MBR1320955.1 response regulator transcription factor [Bradyrhizobium sp. U87765 SZCCT0109]MBR1350391.1 response regulator transcript